MVSTVINMYHSGVGVKHIIKHHIFSAPVICSHKWQSEPHWKKQLTVFTTKHPQINSITPALHYEQAESHRKTDFKPLLCPNAI